MNPSLKFVSLLGALAGLTVSAIAQNRQDSGVTDVPPASAQSKATSPRSSDPANPSINDPAGRNATDPAKRNMNDPLPNEVSRFTTMDKDSDGRVSRSEFTLSSPQLQGGDAALNEEGKAEKKHWWNRKDDKNPSSTNTGELSTGSNSVELFNQLDTDKDGFLTRAELAAQQNGINR